MDLSKINQFHSVSEADTLPQSQRFTVIKDIIIEITVPCTMYLLVNIACSSHKGHKMSL